MLFLCRCRHQIGDPYITYAFASVAAGTYSAFPSIPFDLWAHAIVDHRHGHSVQRLIVSCICNREGLAAQLLNVADVLLFWIMVTMQRGSMWVKEGSTFGFPPSIHGAVGALCDVTLFHWEMDGGGTFRHRGGTTTHIVIVRNKWQ